MWQRLCNHASLAIVGAVVGAVLTAGILGVSRLEPARATATHGADNFAIATGLVDDQLEAIYFLDYLTGDLRAAIMSRRTGQFSGFFEYNIMGDFAGMTDSPKFLMVTGLVDLPRAGRAGAQLASSLIYIAEATSGQVCAYALPYNATTNAAGKGQTGTFIKMGGGYFRDAFVRDQ